MQDNATGLYKKPIEANKNSCDENMEKRSSLEYLGFGLGLRTNHISEILSTKPKIDWFEIISENYMFDGGLALLNLDRIRKDYPIVMHGVSLSIGSKDPLNYEYLKKLKKLAERIEPKWISDHLCWTGINNINSHDLLPVPHTEEAIEHISNRIIQVQEYLGRQILLENPSSYINFSENEMSEWEFLVEIANKSGCLLLLDINNIFVSSHNHKFDAMEYINHIPIDKVQQFHLAGHIKEEQFLIDTHGEKVCDGVWNLYKQAIKRFGKVSTMIERDDNIPPLHELIKELEFAKKLACNS